ncbi:MAG: type I-F CRISPR-associated endonuclease Cas1f [Pseudomonadota bacterium]
MQRKGGPRLLVTDREGALYLERARVHVEGGRIVYTITDDENAREFNVPHVNLAVLFLGQGTSITQEAARLLGEEHVHLAITGTGGTPMHMGALTTYVATGHFRRLLPIYSDPNLSLKAATAIMQHRIGRMKSIGGKIAARDLRARHLDGLTAACAKFEAALKECRDVAQLLGHEGEFSKACYREYGSLVGLKSFRRNAGAGPADAAQSDEPEAAKVALANRLIDHGNYLCYGMAGAALWALGIPPHMSIFHGKTRAGGLVFDLADAFKDALVLPLAFAVATGKKSDNPEKQFRAKLIEAFDDHKVLAKAVETVEAMLLAGENKTIAKR